MKDSFINFYERIMKIQSFNIKDIVIWKFLYQISKIIKIYEKNVSTVVVDSSSSGSSCSNINASEKINVNSDKVTESA